MEASVTKDARRGRSSAQRDPVRTRAAILAAATHEFTAKGLNGARVDTIATRSRVNKRMIYHYFGDKEGLYLAVLEATYTDIRSAEIDLNLEDHDPLDGMRELVEFTWNYFIKHPEFLSLLGTENLHRARYLKQSQKIRDMHTPLVGMISRLLQRGRETGRDPAGHRSGPALHHHRGARLLLSGQPPYLVDDLRSQHGCPGQTGRPRPPHRRCCAHIPPRMSAGYR